MIELACLSVAHLKLLDIARNRDIELFGVGPLPTAMTSDDLSGVRLISLTDLPEAIAAIQLHEALAEMPPAEAPVIRQPAVEPAGETYQPAQTAVEEILPPPSPAPTPPPPPAPAPQAEIPDEPISPGQYLPAEPALKPQDIPESLNGLLSPEELSALLEDDQ